jgi:hypothetical protein
MTDALRLPPTSWIYNRFVLGPAGPGKRSLVRQMLEVHAAGRPVPAD